METAKPNTISEIFLCCSLLDTYVSHCTTDEAAIITHLKTEILTLQNLIQSKANKLNYEGFKDVYNKLCGENDSETLLFVASHLSQLHNNLIAALPPNKQNLELQKLNFQIQESGTRLISGLIQNVLYLQEMIRMI